MKLIKPTVKVETGAVLLDIDLGQPLPQELCFEGKRWILKPELHVTAMSCADLDKRFALSSADFPSDESEKKKIRQAKKEALESIIKECLDGLDLMVGIEPALYAARKDYSLYSPQLGVRRSLVASVIVHDIEELRNRFFERSDTAHFGKSLRRPYHITLYTGDEPGDGRKGIGLYSFDEWYELTRRIAYSDVPSELRIF